MCEVVFLRLPRGGLQVKIDWEAFCLKWLVKRTGEVPPSKYFFLSFFLYLFYLLEMIVARIIIIVIIICAVRSTSP